MENTNNKTKNRTLTIREETKIHISFAITLYDMMLHDAFDGW